MTDANLYMADLAGACLAGANLEGANLIGANLSGADLRGANLSGANLMVADLHNTILHGATLLQMLNLTPEQLQVAVYDSTTTIDSAIDITLTRIPGVHIKPNETKSIPDTIPPVADITDQAMPQTPVSELYTYTSAEEVQPESFIEAPAAETPEPLIETISTGELEPLTETPAAETPEPLVETISAGELEPLIETPDLAQAEEEVSAEAEATSSVTTEDLELDPLPTEISVEVTTSEIEETTATDVVEPEISATTVTTDEAGADEFPDLIGGKVIQLQKRTGKLPAVTSAETTGKTRAISGRGKKKGSARVSKISSISRDDDQQTRAN